MLFTKNMTLELEKIEIVENPGNAQGKFTAFHFRTKDPWPSSIFKEMRYDSKDFSCCWGQMPHVTFYKGDYKKLQKKIMDIIAMQLPKGYCRNDVESWNISIYDWSSPVNDRKWGICFVAKKIEVIGMMRNHNTLNGVIPLAANVIAGIIAELPEINTLLKE